MRPRKEKKSHAKAVATTVATVSYTHLDKIVKDPYGRCIRTPWWTAEKDVPECGGAVAVEPAPPQCEKITLGTDTLFDFDRSELKPRGRARLDQLASDITRAERVSTVKIVGHTDAKGTDAYNMRLGQRRADTVASYLVSRNIPTGKVRTSSMGESQPVAPNTLPNGCLLYTSSAWMVTPRWLA